MANPNKPKIHKLKSITHWGNHIGVCGRGIHDHLSTQDNSKVTCANCLRSINNA